AGPDERRDSRLDSGRDGVMTLAVMTRASLGHTGSALGASRTTEMIYALVVLSAVLRIMASFIYPGALVLIAALAWTAGFGGFALAYGPLLLRPRIQSRRCSYNTAALWFSISAPQRA